MLIWEKALTWNLKLFNKIIDTAAKNKVVFKDLDMQLYERQGECDLLDRLNGPQAAIPSLVRLFQWHYLGRGRVVTADTSEEHMYCDRSMEGKSMMYDRTNFLAQNFSQANSATC